MAPGRIPVLGHLARLHRDALGLIRRSEARLGPVFRIDHGFGQQTVYLCGDDAFDLFYRDFADSGASLEVAGPVIQDTLQPVNGAEHRRMRGAMNGPFSPRGLRAAGVGEILDDVVMDRLARWRGRSELVISNETRELAIDVIFRIIGIKGDELPQWRRQFHEFTFGLIKFPYAIPGSPPWRSQRAVAWMDARLRPAIAACRRQGDHHSLLGAMVHGKDDQGQGVSETELLANLRLLGLAGHETSASVMSWVMLHLAASPRLWERLCEEANAAEGPPQEPSQLKQFPFAEALFREALRLFPPTWFVYRGAIEPFEYRGITIPRGTRFIIPLVALSRSPEVYSRPDSFDPDRWMSRSRKPRPIEMCQFGGGPHFCLGYNLALFEGIFFIIAATRALTRLRRRPVLPGRMPSPRYLPLGRPPLRSKILLEPN